mgnify:CR=1 FL=1
MKCVSTAKPLASGLGELWATGQTVKTYTARIINLSAAKIAVAKELAAAFSAKLCAQSKNPTIAKKSAIPFQPFYQVRLKDGQKINFYELAALKGLNDADVQALRIPTSKFIVLHMPEQGVPNRASVKPIDAKVLASNGF